MTLGFSAVTPSVRRQRGSDYNVLSRIIWNQPLIHSQGSTKCKRKYILRCTRTRTTNSSHTLCPKSFERRYSRNRKQNKTEQKQPSKRKNVKANDRWRKREWREIQPVRLGRKLRGGTLWDRLRDREAR